MIEDDVYVDLRYRGAPVPAFHSFAPGHTVYITSLSKTVAPALRIGITVLPPGLLDPILALKQGIDMQTSALNQAIAAEFLGSAAGSEHIAHIVQSYGTKLRTLQSALRTHFPAGFSWTDPEGGMFVWVEGPANFDTEALVGPALQAGVAFLPGSMFFAGPAAPRNTMRLSFAEVPLGDIDRGIQRLAAVCATS